MANFQTHIKETTDDNFTVGTGGVTAGALVEFSADETVVLAGVNSALFAGWVPYDKPAGGKVPVYRGKKVLVKAAGAIPAAGTRLVCGAGGTAAAIGLAAADDARRIVGHAVEDAVDGAWFKAVIHS